MKNKIKAAVKKMMTAGEFDKIARMYSRAGNDAAAQNVLQIQRNLQQAEKWGGVENIPIIPLIVMLTDAEVWQDIACALIMDTPEPTDVEKIVEQITDKISRLTDAIENPGTGIDVGLEPYYTSERAGLNVALDIIREVRGDCKTEAGADGTGTADNGGR